MNKSLLSLSGSVLSLLLVAQFSPAVAGGCAPGDPCWEDPAPKPMRKPAQVAPAPAPVEEAPMVKEEPKPMAKKMEKGGLNFFVAGGVNLLMFDCEDTHVAPAVYVDVMHDDVPVNVRLGVEGADLEDSEQYKFSPGSRWFQEEPDFTLVRIPLSVEFVQPIADKTEVLVGGGPDLLVLSGEANDTTVGLHLGARVRQALTEGLGVSVGGGYLWGEGDVRDEHYDLDSAFVGADLSYRF